MGKSYFEYLEEAFQSLTSRVQKALAEEEQERQLQLQLANDEQQVVDRRYDDYPYDYSLDAAAATEGSFVGDSSVSTKDHSEQEKSDESIIPLCKLFSRCRVVFQKMHLEAQKAGGDAEFQDRLDLYKIQIQSLTKYYHEMEEERAATKTHEITFTFFDEVDEELDDEDWSQSTTS